MLGEITLIPIGSDTSSMRTHVDRAIAAIRDTGIQATVTEMGTNVIGSMDEILTAFRAAHDAVIDAGAARVMALLRIDDRVDQVQRASKPGTEAVLDPTRTLQ